MRGGCKCGHAGEVPIKGKIWGFKVKKNDIACARRVRGRIDIAIRYEGWRGAVSEARGVKGAGGGGGLVGWEGGSRWGEGRFGGSRKGGLARKGGGLMLGGGYKAI